MNNDHEIKEMVRAAIPRAQLRQPKSIDDFARYLHQEISLELAEA